jgi:hypothetical protein
MQGLTGKTPFGFLAGRSAMPHAKENNALTTS